MSKYGARIYLKSSGESRVILIKQTIKVGTRYTDEYKVDGKTGAHYERHIDPHDDAGIAQAVRDALAGTLREKR